MRLRPTVSAASVAAACHFGTCTEALALDWQVPSRVTAAPSKSLTSRKRSPNRSLCRRCWRKSPAVRLAEVVDVGVGELEHVEVGVVEALEPVDVGVA